MSLPSLYQLLNTPIDQPLCLATLAPFLSAPPWHEASGVFNLRNVFCLPYVKQDFVYRSGMLSFVTGEGKKAIQDALVIKAIFDLRSYEERVTDPGPDFAGLITSYAHNEDIDRVPTEDTQWQSVSRYSYLTALIHYKLCFLW
ncbi:MAG: hypothetical protein M1828_001451 [Chrysothrix sp. TS-e1954]|nr:MAG: hypothetical protein M1828_001451 [Chrysothrix sp. TS-e1954]